MVVKTDRSRILIVDDEPENIWPLVKHLEDEYEILCATDGEQAIEIAFSSDKPDMILLDIIMPGMDGYELCSRLKADARTRNIPLIFLTARNDEVDETRGLEMGAQDYITKPFSLPVVRARIRSVLNLKKELDRRHLLKTQLEEFNAQLEEQVQKKMEELQKTREALKFYEEKYRRLFRKKASGKARRRILVVDDTPENVHILINNLQARFEILCAVSGQDALEIAYSDNPPDLVLLDIMMPGMDGFEVCSRLKANADTWDIPVIFVTALGQDVDEAKGLNLGAVDFITKPFSIPVVEARIRAALRLKEEMDQRIRLTRQLEGLNQDLEHRVREKTAALKQAHEDLLASEKKYRNIYENAPEGIFQVSVEGRFLSANPAMARILGYSSPEEMLASLTDVRRQVYVNPSERDELMAILDEQTAVVGHELQFYKKDGQIACGSISVRVVRDHEGRPVFLEGFFTDVTERKRLEEQLRQAAKMEAIGTLVGGVAHDFNNLMTAVIGYSDLLLATMGGDDPTRSPLEVIRKAGESAATLTKRLLAFSRKQVLQPVVLNINTVVANIEKMLRRMIGEDIELIALPGHSLQPVLADPSQIEQVIMNLAVNARDAMPRGGKLVIETGNVFLDESYCRQNVGVRPGHYVVLSMSDTGMGMSPDILAHMYEPFFTTKRHGKGTGLGLATVYGIVQQSHGHIRVYSEEGKGSTFKVYLPVAEKEAEEAVVSRKAPEGPRIDATVMVAEDDAIVRELAVAILEKQGYTVLAADNGESCLRQLADRQGRIDLLLTDVVMPDLDGKALYLKAADLFPGLKALFMSGYADNVIVRHNVLEEGVHFIQKPFSVQALAAKVREILES